MAWLSVKAGQSPNHIELPGVHISIQAANILGSSHALGRDRFKLKTEVNAPGFLGTKFTFPLLPREMLANTLLNPIHMNGVSESVLIFMMHMGVW